MGDAGTVAATLAGAGLVRPEVTLIPLAGGVSCDVWRIAPGDLSPEVRAAHPHGLVVKAPLARLRVASVWEADVSRGLAEASALRLYAGLTPEQVPPVVWLDAEGPVLVLESAPLAWADWRQELLTAPADSPATAPARLAALGSVLGRTLATWHTRTRDIEALPLDLRAGDRLRTLRTDPFHRATGEAIPALAGELEALARELEDSAVCLVHGDFSPKNVLVDSGPAPAGRDLGGVWVLDAEVAHAGSPLLDVAYLSAHLVLKATKRPELHDALLASRCGFEAAYRSGCDLVDPDAWSRHTGAILAARMRGLSRVDYLDLAQQDKVLLFASSLIRGDASLDDVWAALTPHADS